jgi:hypothetical protein
MTRHLVGEATPEQDDQRAVTQVTGTVLNSTESAIRSRGQEAESLCVIGLGLVPEHKKSPSRAAAGARQAG